MQGKQRKPYTRRAEFIRRDEELLSVAKEQPALTLQELGDKFLITKERVRQLLKKENVKRQHVSTLKKIIKETTRLRYVEKLKQFCKQRCREKQELYFAFPQLSHIDIDLIIRDCGIRIKNPIAEILSPPGWNFALCKHPLYLTYNNMLERCTNPRSENYKNYGGRGITVCERWLEQEGFVNFCFDMGPRPNGRLNRMSLYTLERDNNDLGYTPDNCRWATWKEQANNRRVYKKRQATKISIDTTSTLL